MQNLKQSTSIVKWNSVDKNQYATLEVLLTWESRDGFQYSKIYNGILHITRLKKENHTTNLIDARKASDTNSS